MSKVSRATSRRRASNSASRRSGGSPRNSTTAIFTGLGGMTSCTGSPSRETKRVRSISWRATIAFIAWLRGRRSKGPRARTATGMLYIGLLGSSWSRNHNRCCANESGARFWSTRRGMPGPRACWRAPRKRCSKSNFFELDKPGGGNTELVFVVILLL